ncbi:hypothetical protein PRZ48_009151 [Zasmidium cellare]|uniref:Uncharacterized protein n=1 Tax=Zasmidium cellare TaxID=395010 RepID=A0ABR0EBJ6_ZASCE|nr:hypothetical protein PRZ48_009151 [Zasmidium cellare]
MPDPQEPSGTRDKFRAGDPARETAKSTILQWINSLDIVGRRASEDQRSGIENRVGLSDHSKQLEAQDPGDVSATFPSQLDAQDSASDRWSVQTLSISVKESPNSTSRGSHTDPQRRHDLLNHTGGQFLGERDPDHQDGGEKGETAQQL